MSPWVVVGRRCPRAVPWAAAALLQFFRRLVDSTTHRDLRVLVQTPWPAQSGNGTGDRELLLWVVEAPGLRPVCTSGDTPHLRGDELNIS